MKIIGFNQGQLGDLVINIPLCRAVKEAYPDSRLIFSINKKYAHAAPLFYNHPLIDGFVIWDEYDNWPSEKDKETLKFLSPDVFFHPMPRVCDDNWAQKMHFTEIICANYGVKPPKDLRTTLIKYFDLIPKYKNCIAINPFCSDTTCGRNLPENLCLKIINYIHSLGHETVQLGVSSHRQYPTTYPIPNLPIFEDARIALSCKMMITIDSGMNYIMSGYQHKVLGLYGSYNYPVGLLKNRAPINDKAIYLEGKFISSIPEKDIFSAINQILFLE